VVNGHSSFGRSLERSRFLLKAKFSTPLKKGSKPSCSGHHILVCTSVLRWASPSFADGRT